MTLRLKLHQLEKVAQAAGHEDYKSMLYDLYVVQRLSLSTIASQLDVTMGRIRRHLVRYQIPVRGKGGPNNVKVVVTDDLVLEAAKYGIGATAQRLGVSVTTLTRQLRLGTARKKEG